jgi:hypothetical protein
VLRGSPDGAAVEQLRSRRCEDEQREVAQPLSNRLDELEQAVVGPVQVLEDEDDGLNGCHSREEAPPGREPLRPAVSPFLARAETEYRSEVSLHPIGLGVELERAEGAREFRVSRLA